MLKFVPYSECGSKTVQKVGLDVACVVTIFTDGTYTAFFGIGMRNDDIPWILPIAREIGVMSMQEYEDISRENHEKHTREQQESWDKYMKKWSEEHERIRTQAKAGGG